MRKIQNPWLHSWLGLSIWRSSCPACLLVFEIISFFPTDRLHLHIESYLLCFKNSKMFPIIFSHPNNISATSHLSIQLSMLRSSGSVMCQVQKQRGNYWNLEEIKVLWCHVDKWKVTGRTWRKYWAYKTAAHKNAPRLVGGPGGKPCKHSRKTRPCLFFSMESQEGRTFDLNTCAMAVNISGRNAFCFVSHIRCPIIVGRLPHFNHLAN